MAIRFRKSIKIAPGVRLNIGKKGISSATIGRRGISMNVGKSGAFLNTSIPGTGLSARSQVAGPKVSKKKASESPKVVAAEAPQLAAMPPAPVDAGRRPRRIWAWLAVALVAWRAVVWLGGEPAAAPNSGLPAVPVPVTTAEEKITRPVPRPTLLPQLRSQEEPADLNANVP